MLKSEGIQTVPLSDYEETQIEGYLGSIYLHERNAKLKELADTIEVFHPILPATGYSVTNAYKKNELPVIDETQTNYLVFLGGTHGPYRVLEGGYHTGRNMLLICDSFGNAIAPFFMPYYDDVYMVDFAMRTIRGRMRRRAFGNIFSAVASTMFILFSRRQTGSAPVISTASCRSTSTEG
jgi:hypothetical protein